MMKTLLLSALPKNRTIRSLVFLFIRYSMNLCTDGVETLNESSSLQEVGKMNLLSEYPIVDNVNH